MPFQSGSLSLRRFAVVGDISPNLAQLATIAVRRYSFRPINDDRGEEESFGWVNPRDVLAESFQYEDLQSGQYLLIGARRDKKTFSKVLYRARLQKKIDEIKKTRNLERISRQHRKSLEEEVTIEMLRETSPTSTFYEITWDQHTNVVYLGATGDTICQRLQDLFEATFDIKLRPVFPALLGADFISRQGLENEFMETMKIEAEPNG